MWYNFIHRKVVKNGKIDDVFISHASDILADTNSGLSGSQIIKECNSYAIDFNVSIPITSPNFGKFGSIIPNKRTALYKIFVSLMENSNLSL